jgi:SanA protein
MVRRPRLRSLLFAGLGAGVVLALTVGALNLYVVSRASGEATDDPAALPHAQAAIVLGAYVQPDGAMSGMLRDRVTAAIELYRAGRVDRIIVSGDHHRWSYDEPGTMRDALLRHGVPASAIFTDHAGFNTWASMVRARKVFGVTSAIVVTQGFHMARALYLAHHAGLEAHGLTADLGHHYGKLGKVADARELLARVKAVKDTALDTHVLLGPKHPITGDGRATWGPAAPASASATAQPTS